MLRLPHELLPSLQWDPEVLQNWWEGLMPLQPHLLKDKQGSKTARKEHSICAQGGLQEIWGALGNTL